MDDFSEKLEAILGNPDMMNTIMSMAQSLGPPPEAPPAGDPGPSLPLPDPGLLKAVSAMAGSGSLDDRQRSLLDALGPYLSRNRVDKLEKAMRSAKLAKLASSFLGSGALQQLMGRSDHV